MDGVDCHDQLLPERYLLLLTNRFRNYYVAAFFGLVDLVIVNCFVTCN